MRRSCASAGVFELRIICIASSRLSRIIISPSSSSARSSALSSSNSVRRVTTSCRCSTKLLIRSIRFNVLGRPLTKATLFTENELCNCEYLYSLFSITLALPSRLISMTIRKPCLSDSSFIFDIPSTFFSSANAAIAFINSARLTI